MKIRTGSLDVKEVTVEVECLRCGHREYSTHSTKKRAEAVLQNRGWQTRQRSGRLYQVICPACLELKEKGIWTWDDIRREQRIEGR